MHGIYLKQRVNSFLCMALLAVMTFWVVLYYFTHKAEVIADSYSVSANVHDADGLDDLRTAVKLPASTSLQRTHK